MRNKRAANSGDIPANSPARRRRFGSIALLGTLALLPATGRCGAPFQTDDPNVLDVGHVELLVFYQGTLTATGRSGSSPGFESHFGIFDNAEFDVTTPVAFDTPAGSGTTRGYGDTLVGLKYRLVKESENLPLVSLVPKVSLPTGDSGRGLGNGGSQVFIAVSAERHWDKFLTFVNAGYWINNGSGNRDYAFFGGEAQYQFSDRWIIGAEIFHTSAQAVHQPFMTGFNIGGYCIFDKHNQVLFSAGRGLQNATETNRVSAYIGYQLSF
jgi:hypothetical protein